MFLVENFKVDFFGVISIAQLCHDHVTNFKYEEEDKKIKKKFC